MSIFYSFNTGASAYSNPDEPLSQLAFGARYTSYRNVDRFLDQTDDANLGLIVWPGGTLAETRDDRFGFEFDGLYNSDTGKPSITEMMQTAIDEDAALSIVLPSARYADDPNAVVSELRAFLFDLLSGDLGPLPDTLIFEIGSEYYSNIADGLIDSAASQYGAIAEVMVSEIVDALGDPAVNLVEADIDIAVQLGKTLEDDAAIRAELSTQTIQHTDMVIHHRFAYLAEGIDPRIEELEAILAGWSAGAEGAAPDLFVSAWNTVSLTRTGVLQDFIADEAAAGRIIAAEDVDLEGRTTTAFENYWQAQLEDVAYGQEHAAYILESFSSYAEAGMDAGAVYGVDLIHPGRLSYMGDDQTHYNFAGAEMIKMIYESVGNTHVLSSNSDYSRDDPVTTYAFENDDKLVVFLSAGATAAGDVELQIDEIGDTYHGVWGDRLSSETLADWMAIFGVPDNSDVDESAEAETYAVGAREAASIEQDGDLVTVTLNEPFEVVRLAFAKTEAGAAEIASWSDDEELELLPPDSLPIIPGGDDHTDDEGDGAVDDFAMVAEAASMGGGGLILLLLLLLV
ncbi:MAG: hypothetical protein ACR2OY_10510 [Boseongicola sp.]